MAEIFRNSTEIFNLSTRSFSYCVPTLPTRAHPASYIQLYDIKSLPWNVYHPHGFCWKLQASTTVHVPTSENSFTLWLHFSMYLGVTLFSMYFCVVMHFLPRINYFSTIQTSIFVACVYFIDIHPVTKEWTFRKCESHINLSSDCSHTSVSALNKLVLPLCAVPYSYKFPHAFVTHRLMWPDTFMILLQILIQDMQPTIAPWDYPKSFSGWATVLASSNPKFSSTILWNMLRNIHLTSW